MKKFLIFLAFLIPTITINAQDTGWSAGLAVGMTYSGNENSKYEQFADLLGGTVRGAIEYDFNNLTGIRVAGMYDDGVSSSNIKESHRDYDDFYKTHNLSLFVDGVINLSYLLTNKCHDFNVKCYAGVGAGLVFGYGDAELGWYHVTDMEQFAMGVRGGMYGEYRINDRWSALIDATLTGYQDNFNGVSAGVCYDLQASLIFGAKYYF